uniref:Transmembrane protein n=1 Tax=Brugia pahangi TaxID=6280 RepID=A0A158PSG6_BRUPA
LKKSTTTSSLVTINNPTSTTNKHKHPKIKHHRLLKLSRTENIVYAEQTTFTIVLKLRSNEHRSVPLIIFLRIMDVRWWYAVLFVAWLQFGVSIWGHLLQFSFDIHISLEFVEYVGGWWRKEGGK